MKYENISESLYIKGRIGWKGLKKGEYLKTGDYRIINGSNISNGVIDWSNCGYITKQRYFESPEIMLKKGDILITKDGTIGKVAIVNKLEYPSTIASGLFILRNNAPEKWNTLFLYYYLQTNRFKEFVHSRTEGSVIPHLYQKDFENLEIPYISLTEQYKISSKLDLIQRKISLNRQINDNLFELAKIFFDYVKTSTTKKFSDIVSIQNGFAFKSKNYVKDKQLVILRTKNINSNNLFESKDVVYIPYSLKDQYSRFAFKKFDSVLVMIGSNIGKTGFVTSNNLPSLQNQNMWRFRSTNKNISGLLIYEYVNFINNKVKNSAVGSARAFYKKELFVDYPVPIIKKDNNFVFKKLELEINNICKETDTLLLLKELLLNIYF